MATDFEALYTTMQRLVGDRTATGLAEFKKYINWAGRDVENAHDWPELWSEAWLVTVAPYSTGTISITSGTKNVTGAGTVFPSDAASLPRRLALSYTDPWYSVATRSSDTALVLDENYSEADVSAGSYVLYCDRYTLGATVKKVRKALVLYSGYTKPVPLDQMDLDDISVLGTRSGPPEAFAFDGYNSSGYSRIRFYPVPDAVYRVLIRYTATYTDLSATTDESPLLESRRDLILSRALWYAYRLRGDSGKAADEIRLYDKRLAEEMANTRPADDTAQMRRWDEVHANDPLVNYKFPAEA